MGLRLGVKVKLYTPFWVVKFFYQGWVFSHCVIPPLIWSLFTSLPIKTRNEFNQFWRTTEIWDSKHLYKKVLNLPKREKLITNTVGDKAFVEFFEKLAINCHKLREIRITFDYLSKEVTDWNHFMPSFNAINRLKSFKLIHKSSSECET